MSRLCRCRDTLHGNGNVHEVQGTRVKLDSSLRCDALGRFLGLTDLGAVIDVNVVN